MPHLLRNSGTRRFKPTNKKSLQIAPILSQISPPQAITPYFFQILIILPSTPIFSSSLSVVKGTIFSVATRTMCVLVPLITILIILAKPTCHKWPDSDCVLDGEAMKATNVLWVGPTCRQGQPIARLRPRFLKPESLYNAMQCRNANIKKDKRREIRKEVAFAYLKLLSDTG